MSEDVIACGCDHPMDRDLNSVINILVKFLRSDELSHQSSLSEESFLNQ
ncbi:MAG: hypothetical protein GF364_09255 [Candidatus Lokiarchaeota archaeon]|nr:hypothetical protein [Candidatus Lokiarchaeota archaeon]